MAVTVFIAPQTQMSLLKYKKKLEIVFFQIPLTERSVNCIIDLHTVSSNAIIFSNLLMFIDALVKQTMGKTLKVKFQIILPFSFFYLALLIGIYQDNDQSKFLLRQDIFHNKSQAMQ